MTCPDAPAAEPSRTAVPPELACVREDAVREARIWERHIIEVDTGLLPGRPEGAPPRPGYDPARHTLVERYHAKAAELSGLLDSRVSWHTVQRKRLTYRDHGLWGLVDKRRTRTRSLYGQTDPHVVDLLLDLVEQRAGRPGMTARELFALLRHRVGDDSPVPAEPTLYKLLARLGITVDRQHGPARICSPEIPGLSQIPR
ncbi:hypothetical protein OK074_3668 [Actinobacteria bacterium OK074]|nr:hypothetical protein OK074_3668 [Actinobacteria bacterium OK074]